MESKKHIFTPVEKKLFLEIVSKYRNLVESKETDSVSLRNKNEAWAMIAKEFHNNPRVTCQVTSKQLRRLLMNLKQRQRIALRKERLFRIDTGRSVYMDPGPTQDQPGFDDSVDHDSNLETDDHSDIETKPIVVSITSDHLLPPVDASNPLLRPDETPNPLLPPTTEQKSFNTPTINSTSRSQEVGVEIVNKTRETRFNEKHNLQMLILKEQLKEAKSRSRLAELLVSQQERTMGITSN